MRSLFLVLGFYSVVIALAFSVTNVFGLMLMTLLALFVLPPFVQVGAFTTTGFRRAFFIGAVFGGIPHFVITVYYLTAVGLTAEFADLDGWFSTDETCSALLIYHLVGIGLASFGGLSGFVSYGLLHGFRSTNPVVTEIESKRDG